MSGVVDVGEAFELTFEASPGATVTYSWLDPDQAAVIDMQPVVEDPPGSGRYPKVFTPSSPGVWTAWFYGPGQPERYYIRAAAPTGPPPFAAIGDVTAQYGALTAAQEGLVGHLVRAASALLRQQVPSLATDVRGGLIDAEVAALTVANMVLRVIRNPEGLRAETTGPFSRTYDTGLAAGLLVVTDYDRSAVTPVTATPQLPNTVAALGVGTIRVQATMAPPCRAGLPWRGHGY